MHSPGSNGSRPKTIVYSVTPSEYLQPIFTPHHDIKVKRHNKQRVTLKLICTHIHAYIHTTHTCQRWCPSKGRSQRGQAPGYIFQHCMDSASPADETFMSKSDHPHAFTKTIAIGTSRISC